MFKSKNKIEKIVLEKVKAPPPPIDMSRRYFALGLFASAFLFKKNLINPTYQISRTGRLTVKLSMMLYKVVKFILLSKKK